MILFISSSCHDEEDSTTNNSFGRCCLIYVF
uniref:Uncharacterized protein n=1 Tax=Lepeophtheirus salmonis TaxID=72036 RepID=A0A0K2TMB5_LEPSM